MHLQLEDGARVACRAFQRRHCEHRSDQKALIPAFAFLTRTLSLRPCPWEGPTAPTVSGPLASAAQNRADALPEVIPGCHFISSRFLDSEGR